MCGIAGIVYEGVPREAAITGVRRMIALQRHRGPDGEGFYDGDGASLGHCRLAIIDLTNAGYQPMPDVENRYWITFNGEIYNYLELAEQLRGLGHRFRSRSDTEVLLAAYRQWGVSCLERLRGMFAFAIWDSKKRYLFAARDRLGIKPFHYWTNNTDRLAFASEIKALLEFLPERRANALLAGQFLAWNVLDHDPAQTMIAGIKRLPAAHYMTWGPGEKLLVRRYWSLPTFNTELDTSPKQRDELIGEFRDRFDESIALHLRSDVPVGTCLSGGLDSSSIVCAVSTELRRRGVWREEWQQTFSACFNEPELDERPFIEAVTSSTGSRNHVVIPEGDRLSEEMNTWLWHQEEPVSTSNMYAHFCVARLVREHGIKVVLDGQGADELLAGYRKFILVYLKQLVASRRPARAASEALSFFLSPEILRTSRFVDGRRYLLSTTAEVQQLWPGNQEPEKPDKLALGRSLGGRLAADLLTHSLPVLLRYEDRNTMAFGVESRVPFVDHNFVEWLTTLPADMRLSDGWTKRILRDALADILPKRVRARKSKLGFLTPQSKWLHGPLAGWLKETLRAPRHLTDILDLKCARELLARYIQGSRSLPLENILFRLAIYESWARQFLESTPVPNRQASIEWNA